MEAVFAAAENTHANAAVNGGKHPFEYDRLGKFRMLNVKRFARAIY